MFDFDVLGISEGREGDDRSGDALALATVRLNELVIDVPRAPALVLAPETTVAAAVETLRRRVRGAAVVIRHQRPIGVVTDRDILGRAGDHDWRTLAVADLMIPCEEPLHERDTVGTALRRMCGARRWHLPLVCRRGLLLGSVDIADLSLWLRDRMTMLSVDAALAQSWARGA